MQYSNKKNGECLGTLLFFLERKRYKNVDFMGETADFTEKRIAQGHLKQ